MQEPLITITLSAYERLKAIEEGAISFSKVIRENDLLVIANERILAKSDKSEWKDITEDHPSYRPKARVVVADFIKVGQGKPDFNFEKEYLESLKENQKDTDINYGQPCLSNKDFLQKYFCNHSGETE